MSMTHSIRPGGLTALAVINFVLAGFMAIGLIGTGALIGCISMMQDTFSQVMPVGYLVIQLLLDLCTTVALIMAGIGYLKMHRSLSLVFGNVYVLLALLKAVLSAFVFTGFGQKPDMGFLVNNLYLLVTLVFVNVVFSDIWRTNHRPKLAGSDSKISPVFLMFFYSLRQNLRSAAGVLVTFLGTTVILWLAQIPFFFIDISKSIEQGMGQMSSSADIIGTGLNTFTPVLASYLGFIKPDTGWAVTLLQGPEGIYSLSLLMLTIVLPFLVVTTSATQISSDTTQAGIRFLLLRAPRKDIYLSKVIASTIVAFSLVTLITVFNFLYFFLHYQVGDPGLLISMTLRGLGVNLLLTLPYVLIGIFFSAVISFPVGSWLAAEGTVLFPLFPFLFSLNWLPARFFELVLPSRLALFGFHPDISMVMVGVFGALLYSGGVFLAGRALFLKRDM